MGGGVHVSFQSMVFSGVCKNNEQKSQLNRAGRPEGGALMPCHYSRAQQQEERLLFFPGKGLADEKPGLCLLCPSQLLFRSIEAFSFLCHVGTCRWLTMVAVPELQFSADSK